MKKNKDNLNNIMKYPQKIKLQINSILKEICLKVVDTDDKKGDKKVDKLK